VIGIKEAGGNPDRVSQLRAATGGEFTILCGDDSLTLPFMAVGADGVVSVASNIIPREVAMMVKAYAMGRSRLHRRSMKSFSSSSRTCFWKRIPFQSRPHWPMLGAIEEEYRLPLVAMSAKNREVLRGTLHACGLLKT